MMAFAANIPFSESKFIENYDASGLGVTLRYSSANTSATMDIPVIKGSPYITAIYTNLQPLIYQVAHFVCLGGGA